METFIKLSEAPACVAETDVLVCGGGPAGIGAALQAAQMGARVLILEMGGCLGGIATAGMMSHWGGRSSSKFLPELTERSRQMDLGEAAGAAAALAIRESKRLRDVDVKMIQEVMGQ